MRNSMKHISTTLIFFIYFGLSQLYANTDFRAGYLITHKQDTVQGYIDYKGMATSSKKCVFKTSLDGEPKTYLPTDIQAYRFVDGKYYVSKNIEVDGKTQTVFLEYLINGTVDVYFYRDVTSEYYYVDKGDGALHLLKNEKKEVVVNNERYMQNSKEYIGILRYVFNKSPKFIQKAENAQLNHKSLIKIANEYHQETCEGETCIVYEKKLPKSKFLFGVTVGGAVNYIDIADEVTTNDDLAYLNNANLEQSNTYVIGLNISKSLPYLNDRLSLQYDGLISKLDINFTSERLGGGLVLGSTVTFNQQVFNNALTMRYEGAGTGVRPVLLGGCFMNYHFGPEFQRVEDINTISGTYIASRTYTENPFEGHNFGFVFGLGLAKNIMNRVASLEARYYKGLGMTYEVNVNSLAVTLSYKFGKF